MKCYCFLQNKWLWEGDKAINTMQVSAQKGNKMCTCKERSFTS